MQLTSTPITNPSMAFSNASHHYLAATDALTSSVELPWSVLEDRARTEVGRAVTLLAPHTASDDRFVRRSAATSVTQATEALELLDGVGSAASQQDAIDQVVAKLREAEQALWSE